MSILMIKKALILAGAALIVGPLTISTSMAASTAAQQTSAQYKTAMKHCNTLKGTEHDTCVKDAKTHEKTTKTDTMNNKKPVDTHAATATPSTPAKTK